MTDLTEKCKKGELKEGEEYWVILTDEWYSRNPVEPVRAFYSCDCEFEGYLDDDIKEVLAPVPSYDEWKVKLEENTKLKELLKECHNLFAREQVQGSELTMEELITICTKIEEAIKWLI